jgi:hypothetical protein
MLGAVAKRSGRTAARLRRVAAAVVVVIVSGGTATANAEHSDGADRGANGDAIDNQNDAILAMPEHPKKVPSGQPKQPARHTPCPSSANCAKPTQGAPRDVR